MNALHIVPHDGWVLFSDVLQLTSRKVEEAGRFDDLVSLPAYDAVPASVAQADILSIGGVREVTARPAPIEQFQRAAPDDLVLFFDAKQIQDSGRDVEWL